MHACNYHLQLAKSDLWPQLAPQNLHNPSTIKYYLYSSRVCTNIYMTEFYATVELVRSGKVVKILTYKILHGLVDVPVQDFFSIEYLLYTIKWIEVTEASR